MGERLTINMITPNTGEWTCKIQVIDKGRPKDNKEKTKKYQLMTLQDEEENQVQAIMFNADIMHFEDLFDPFHTYLVSVAQVKESSYLYGNPLDKFTWTIDRSTIVEPIEKVTPPEDPLPPPTRLSITTFDTFEYQPKESEFDVLAIVINGGPSTYAANGRRIQEFIVMDKQKKTTKFTLWEDFIDLYGNKLLKQLNEYPVILARKIGRSSSGSSNKFSGLSNKFSTTIYFNPPYPQAVELKSWAKTIEPMLNAYKIKSTSSTGSVMVVPFEEEIIAISNIEAQPQGQVFYVEAELCLANENQRFCVLACSDCKQLFTRSFSRRTIYCTNCQRSTHLIPRCQFEVTVRDNSGFATAIISDKPAEKMLCLSSEEIYDIYHVKKQILPLADVQKQLSGKIFKIQMKKLFTKYHDAVQKLSILSYMNKENEINQEFQPSMMDVATGSKRKIERLGLEGKEAHETTNKDNASYYKRGLEIRTPPFKK